MSQEKDLTETIENYCKAIYTLSQGNGVDVELASDVQVGANQQRIADAVGVSISGVSKMLKAMQRAELVTYSPYHPVKLTERGTKIAIEVIRHHRLLELYLTQSLGFGWEAVHREADRLEHYISEEMEDRIEAALGYPAFDPHGDPIPSRTGEMPPFSRRPLSSCTPGANVAVSRVTDEDDNLLKYLAEKGIRPGVTVTLLEREPFGGSFVLQIGDSNPERLSPYAANHVFVDAEGKAAQK
jgi:DtxR family Mn-dependent transcriptional regulator